MFKITFESAFKQMKKLLTKHWAKSLTTFIFGIKKVTHNIIRINVLPATSVCVCVCVCVKVSGCV